jgi:hypothetical protein
MEPNKLENQIKKELHSREIQPSTQAWNRLDAMLSEAEEKKIRRPFGFLSRNFGIAASIIVFLTVGMFLFTQKDTKIQPKNDVVTSETKDTIQKKGNEISTPRVENNQEVVSNQPSTDNRQPTTNNQRVSISNQRKSTNQNQIIKDKAIEFEYSSDVALKDLPKIEKRKEIKIESNKSVISDDDLLAGIDTAAKQTIKKQKTVKVDAKNLLSQVDGELELTFREKVIKKVTKKYKEVKVAIANRNIQE